MKETDAIQHLEHLMLGLQRYRGIVRENFLKEAGDDSLGFTDEQLAELWPWVFGEQCPLPALSKILDGAASGKHLVPLDYYNMIFVFTRFMPEVLVTTETLRRIELPKEPDTSWLRGWEV